MATEAQKRASKKYNNQHTKIINIRLNLATDEDVLVQLDSVENKAGYIKKLIREDIKKSNGQK